MKKLLSGYKQLVRNERKEKNLMFTNDSLNCKNIYIYKRRIRCCSGLNGNLANILPAFLKITAVVKEAA